MKTAFVIRHVAFEDLGSLAPALEVRGYTTRYIEAGADTLGTIEAESPDLLIILGGPIGAYDEQDYPFLKEELKILERRLKADLPTLGICLGAQLIARVLGAKVYLGSRGKEIGWLPISLSKAGQKSALQPLMAAEAVLHWHGDTFSLPDGCVHLASSSKYENQAFSYGQNTLALQFHPEVIPETLGRWFIGHAHEISSTEGLTVANLQQDTQRHGERLRRLSSACWQQWLNQIESSYIRQQPAMLSYITAF